MIPLPAVLLSSLACVLVTARSQAGDAPMVPRWQRFERQFKSDRFYTNPFAIAFNVEFRSPQGESQTVPGFWDGAKTWRVRCLPGFAGRWSFRTSCSDTNDSGLHGRTGEFLCIAGDRGNRFAEHGPLRVAREGTFFEHADRTPIFLLMDLGWNSVRQDPTGKLESRARDLAAQHFNALAWTLWPGKDDRKEEALDARAPGGLNLEFFQRSDAKVEAITRAGLLNVIAPAWEMNGAAGVVPEELMTALIRQAVARWHANPVLWLPGVESDSGGENIGRWRRIARGVFGDGQAGPVILATGESHWVWNEFRDESWVAGLGYKSAHIATDDLLQWFFFGPLSQEHKRVPSRLVLDVMPMKGSEGARTRQLLWSGLLMNPPSGICRQTEAAAKPPVAASPAMTAAGFFGSIDFRKLRPAVNVLADRPGAAAPERFVAAAATEARDLIVIYSPGGNVRLVPSMIPSRHVDEWFDPRTGGRRPAVGLMSPSAASYQTPDDGDWVLVVRATK